MYRINSLPHLRPAMKVALASTVVTALALSLSACGDAGAADQSAVAAVDLTVSATDFDFGELPAAVAVGSTVTLVNEAPTEMHELVAIRLPEEEERPVDELLQLPEEEVVSLFSAAPPAMVLLAAPDADQIVAMGDNSFTEPGRYLLICAIPTGVDAATYLAAAAEADHGPPEVEGGAPHFVHGMFAEIEVVAES